ncbi:hypothetical protein CASFOL_004080 [Castilleja foliolosa]|uniref:Replication protein A OB domain-containing protein n=1 Tax=Castilleja foliolosa TaxID=1961234 RepID=A0ABD3EMI4_9LAMI
MMGNTFSDLGTGVSLVTRVRFDATSTSTGAPAPQNRNSPAATTPLLSISKPSSIVKSEFCYVCVRIMLRDYCCCSHGVRSSDPPDIADRDPVLLVSGIAGSILNSKRKKFGFETRVWVRILLADLEFRKKLWSIYNPETGYTEPLDDSTEIIVPQDDYGLYAIDILDPSTSTGMSSDYGGCGGKACFCASVGLRFIKKLKPGDDPAMAPKLLKDIKYPDYPKMIEVRVVNKWYTRGNILQFSYLFVDITGYGVETQAPLTDEIDLERMISLQQCYRITNYTTVKARTYSPVVPNPISILISKHTHFQPVVNESIPLYYFNFVTLDELEDRLPKGSPLSDYVGRAESVTEMMPTTEKKTGNTIYLRRVVIMDDRSRPIEVTLWEDKGRAVDKAAALHQIVAVTATYAKKFLRDIQLT